MIRLSNSNILKYPIGSIYSTEITRLLEEQFYQDTDGKCEQWKGLVNIIRFIDLTINLSSLRFMLFCCLLKIKWNIEGGTITDFFYKWQPGLWVQKRIKYGYCALNIFKGNPQKEITQLRH